MSILDVLKQNEQFYRDLDQGIVSGNRLPLLPNEDVMYNSVIPTDYSTLQKDESEEDEYEDLDVLRFKNMDLQSGYLDRAGSYPGTNFDFNQPNFFQRMLSGASDMYGSGRDLIGTGIGTLVSLASGIPGIGLLTGLINPNPQSAIDTRRLQQAGYGTQLQDIYGPGGIMQNYNMISACGRGPLESIINRRNKAKSEAIRNKLNQSITQLGGSTDTNLSAYRASRPASERRSTGPAGSGRDNTGGARGASDSFSNRSGMGRTGY